MSSIGVGVVTGPCECGEPDCKGLGTGVVVALRAEDGQIVHAGMNRSQALELARLLVEKADESADAADAIPERPARVN